MRVRLGRAGAEKGWQPEKAAPSDGSVSSRLLPAVVFPQDLLEKGLEADNFAMLGLGDIVIPGDCWGEGCGGGCQGLN